MNRSSHPLSAQAARPGEGAEGHGEADSFDPAPHRPSGRGPIVVAVAILVLFCVLLAAGVVPRVTHRASMDHEARAASADVPRVRVAKAQRTTAPEKVVLPGSVQPLQETSIYARANGYVRKWYVDIGAPVKAGQVLVDLDLPDLDAELRQGRASAQQAKAGISQSKTQLDYARTTSDRFAGLGKSGVVSQQEIDQYSSAYGVQQAGLEAARAASASAQANVHRLEDLRGFGTIVAPFDGVVTLRNAEIGQLVVSGTGLGQALFKVAEVDVVRIFVNVPQLYAGAIRVGMDAPTTLREFPGRAFPGKVARTANELDLTTRSLLTEIDIPNGDRALVAGSYAQVAFSVSRQDQPIVVPATAVTFDVSGTRVAAVRDGAIHWQPVQVGLDLGDRIAIATGLADGEVVAATPSERLTEGTRVRAEEAP